MRFSASIALLAGLTAIAPAATLTIEFKVPAEQAKGISESSLLLRRVDQTRGMFETVAEKNFPTAGFKETFKDLPVGRYVAIICTGKLTEIDDGNRVGAFRDKSTVMLGADSNETTTFTYKPFDPAPYKGETSITGVMKSTQGSPIVGKEIAAAVYDDTVGLYKMGKTTTDAEGKFEIGSLANQHTFMVVVGGKPVAEAESGGVTVDVLVAPGVGDVAPNFTYLNAVSGTSQKFSDHKGKIVYIDFWASWCNPCQAPLAELNGLFTKHPEWKDKVVVLPISIDNERDEVTAHLKRRQWANLVPLWGGEGAFAAPGPAMYAVNSIPSVVLVNQAGIIVATGHPAEFDKEALIKDLLNWGPAGRPGAARHKLSIVVPIYNERALLPIILERIRAVNYQLPMELILVDDCSRDGTREWLRENEVNKPGTKVLYHKRNHGKGAALRTGFKHATGDVIIVQDADLEYDPAEIPSVIQPIIDRRCKVSFGSRFLGRTPTGMRLPNYVANRLLAWMVILLFGQVITDEATALKAFDASVLRKIKLRCKRFEFCPEVTAKVLLMGERIHEVPVTFFARTVAEGKKIGWRDFFEATYTLLRCRFGKM